MLKIILASGCKIMDLNESKVYPISGCLKLANVVKGSERRMMFLLLPPAVVSDL